jgi:hypothetical protein
VIEIAKIGVYLDLDLKSIRSIRSINEIQYLLSDNVQEKKRRREKVDLKRNLRWSLSGVKR